MRELIDWYRVFDRIPEIMGLELVRNGKMWEGRYYLNGDVHPYRQDTGKTEMLRAVLEGICYHLQLPPEISASGISRCTAARRA